MLQQLLPLTDLRGIVVLALLLLGKHSLTIVLHSKMRECHFMTRALYFLSGTLKTLELKSAQGLPVWA